MEDMIYHASLDVITIDRPFHDFLEIKGKNLKITETAQGNYTIHVEFDTIVDVEILYWVSGLYEDHNLGEFMEEYVTFFPAPL